MQFLKIFIICYFSKYLLNNLHNAMFISSLSIIVSLSKQNVFEELLINII